MKSIDTLTKHISQWGYNRQITINGKPMSQAIKTLEETTELLDAINSNNKAETIDAIGDIYVTLVMVAETSGLNINSCIESAYEEIRNRTGHLTSEGVFVKDET